MVLASWRVIPGFTRYEVSDRGRVRRVGRYGCLATDTSDSGYLRVYIRSDDGGWRRMRVHLLVLSVWVGPRPSPTHEGAHGPRGKLCNHASNLSWKTREENEADKREAGTLSKGPAGSRPDDDVVKAIRAAVEGGLSLSKTAKAFGVHRSTASRYVRQLRRAG